MVLWIHLNSIGSAYLLFKNHVYLIESMQEAIRVIRCFCTKNCIFIYHCS